MLKMANELATIPGLTLKEPLDSQLRRIVEGLQSVSHNLVEGSFVAETRDREDHAFSGIMFAVEAKRLIPFQFLEIQSVSVRGDMGRVTVYSRTMMSSLEESDWQPVFGPEDVAPSWTQQTELKLHKPVRIAPGMQTVLYVHSELPSDTAIVYADQRSEEATYEDYAIRIHPGIAHTANVAFAPYNHWGGVSWRRRREFVGSIRYGSKLLLWTPASHRLFPQSFQRVVRTLLCAHASETCKSDLGRLPKDVLFNIINFLPWDTALDVALDEAKPAASKVETSNRERRVLPSRDMNLSTYLRLKLVPILVVLCCAVVLDYTIDWRQRLAAFRRFLG